MHCVHCYVDGETITPSSFMVDGTSVCLRHMTTKSAPIKAKPKVTMVKEAPPSKGAKKKAPSSK